MTSYIFDKTHRLVSWKGQTFNQITSNYQQNKNTGRSNLFNSPPIKLYRKEIASVKPTTCSKQMISIDELNQPGGSIIQPLTNQNASYNGLVNTLDFNLTKNASERPGICTDKYLCQENNARRRVRSAGMVKKKDVTNVSKNYYTGSYAYLQSRSKTFAQNQYNYIQLAAPGATPSAKPGDAYSTHNTYYPNSSFIALDNSCVYVPQVYYKPNNNSFATQGAVSSSDRTTRKIYNTITKNASLLNKAFGSHTADALAYGVPSPGYTAKDVVGYPNTKTPVIKPNGTLNTCNTYIYRM
jgi:hypothetical protein